LDLDVGNSRKGYRNKLEIIRDILFVVKVSGGNGSKKTHIMYGANLSYKLLTRYVEGVLEAGLISYDGESYYKLTEKGKMFLECYDEYETKRRDLEKRINHINNGREILEKMLTP